MNKRENQSEQKLRGGYYTPDIITTFLANWVVRKNNNLKILEPSAGNGKFVERFIGDSNVNLTAIELLTEEAKKIEAKINGVSNIRVINDDFYKYYNEAKELGMKFDTIIGNPPYIRYQYLTEEQRVIQSKILVENGLKSNKLINSWVSFTVACIDLLVDGGEIAFVIPSDILQVSYARGLRKYLFEQLKELTIITFDEIVFDDIQQDVILLVGKKKESYRTSKHKLRVANLRNALCLSQEIFNLKGVEYIEYDSDKWSKFYLDEKDRIFYETTFMNKTESFSTYAKGFVGVTTGNNDYLLLKNSEVKKYSLEKYVIPVLAKSSDINGVMYERTDFNINKLNEKKVWLLDTKGKKISESAQSYIKKGELSEQNKGYKLSLRERWYDVPSIWIPQLFLLRRIGAIPKIVENKIGATSTDTFHRVELNNPASINRFIVLMHSSVTLLTFELEGRRFGGGALEILPGDLQNLRLPLVDGVVDFDFIAYELNEKLKSGINYFEVVKWIDTSIMSALKFNKREMIKINQLWTKLNNKRY